MPFDLDKVIAEQPKTPRKKRFEFTFDSQTYVLPNEVDVIALRAAAEGDLLAVLERALSAADFVRIRASKKILTQATMGALIEAYYQHLAGLSVGESAASSTRSKSTARPSKRTSKPTTRSRSRK